ncbi:hypothetical protein D3C76_793660 [compost metagenome]
MLRQAVHVARGEHRRQGQRGDHGDQDGHRHAEGEFAEQPADDAAHEQQRNERGDQREADGNHREADFRRALQRRLQPRLAALQVAMDVLHHHDGVVDDEADRDDQRHQGQVVEGEAEQVHRREAGAQRHRQHRGDDQGGGQLAQEQPHHHDHQRNGDQQGQFHLVQRGANGSCAVVENFHLDARRQHLAQTRQGLADSIGSLDDVRPRLAQDHQGHPRLAVRPGLHVVVFRRGDDTRHVLEEHRRAVAIGDHQVVVLAGAEQLVVGRQGGNPPLTEQRALGLVAAGRLQRLAQVGEGQAVGGKLLRLRLDADRRTLLAGNEDLPHPGNLAELARQQHLGVVAQLDQRHQAGADTEDHDRAVRRVDLAPHRQVRHVVRQAPGGGIDRRLHFLGGDVDVLLQLELQVQHGGAECAAGGHLAHPGDGAELHFQRRGH